MHQIISSRYIIEITSVVLTLADHFSGSGLRCGPVGVVRTHLYLTTNANDDE